MRAVIFGVLLAIGVAACSSPSTVPPASAPPSGAPSPEPSVVPSVAPSAVPSHTPVPTAKPIAFCLASQLSAKITNWSGATGHQIASVTLTNTSAHPCTVQGTPEVELVDRKGNILTDSQTDGPSGLAHIAKGAPAFHLAHGASLKTLVDNDNYCGAAPALPTTVAFVFPANAGRLVAVAKSDGSVPPCNRSPGSPGSISMNGWAK